MKKIFSFIFIFSLLFVPHFVQAGFLDSLACVSSEDPGTAGMCQLADVKAGFIALTKLLIGAVGALALLYFIWGGIQWLTSYGNQQKVQHGRDIMLQTVVALVVAFTSFLLVEFFVNDFLGAKTPITSQCANVAKNTSCGENYVCSGKNTFSGELALQNETCMTKCQLKSLEDEETNWTCLSPAIASMAGVIYERNKCPGTTLCVDVNSIAIDTSYTPPIRNYCCVNNSAGRPSCRDAEQDICYAGEELVRQACGEVAMCDPNWVQDDTGCCLDSAPNCQSLAGGMICNNMSANACEWIEACGCDTEDCLE